MGIAPSVHDFSGLQGYVEKSDKERIDILEKAGYQIDERDEELGKFLNTDNITGGFIRGLITECIKIFATQVEKKYEAEIEMQRKKYEEELEKRRLSIIGWQEFWKRSTERHKEEMDKELKAQLEKEKQYYSRVDPKQHLSNAEKGVQEDDDMIKYRENN